MAISLDDPAALRSCAQDARSAQPAEADLRKPPGPGLGSAPRAATPRGAAWDARPGRAESVTSGESVYFDAGARWATLHCGSLCAHQVSPRDDEPWKTGLVSCGLVPA